MGYELRGRFVAAVIGVTVLFGVSGDPTPAKASVSLGGGTVVIDNPESFDRVIAMSDAHGMYSNLTQLLIHAKVINSSLSWTAGKTLLIVVGDSVDKGSQSLEVMDLWIALQAQALSVGGATDSPAWQSRSRIFVGPDQ